MWACLFLMMRMGLWILGKETIQVERLIRVHSMISTYIPLVMFTQIPFVDAVNWISLL